MELRKIIVYLIVIFTMNVNAQNFEIGLRDNQYIHAAFIGKQQYLAGFEQSILNVKVKEQNGRLFAGYQHHWQKTYIMAIAYSGIEYTGKWNNLGTFINGGLNTKYCHLGGSIGFHHDSKLGNNICYNLEVCGTIYTLNKTEDIQKRLEVVTSVGNFPEYRETTMNLRAGLKFTYGDLWVKPVICIPRIDKQFNRVRVLCSMGWSFSI